MMMIIVTFFLATISILMGTGCLYGANQSPAVTVPTQTAGSPSDDKIGKVEMRLDEISKRADITLTASSSVASSAVLALDSARYQITLFTTIMAIITPLIVGAIGYLYLEYNKLREETRQGVIAIKATEENARALHRDLTAQSHYILAAVALREWQNLPTPSILNRAVFHCERGLEAEPVNKTIKAQLWTVKGGAQKRLGRYHDALTSINTAEEILPDNITYRYNRACYTKLAGNLIEGLRLLREAVQSEPYFKTVALTDPDWQDSIENEEFKKIVA
jgi:tetratricopeptide (TPR) repeat protein